jgi:HEAT repeat protein
MNSIASFPPKDEAFRLPMKSALLAEAENSSSKVRTTAITQLKNFEGNDVVAALHSALRDSSYYVVAAAIQSLEKVNPKKALNDIKAYVDTPSYRNVVANAALNALTTLDPDRAVDVALQKVRYGENVSGRRTALSVLTKFGGKRKEVLAAYEALTTDKNPDLRITAVFALASARNSQLPMTSRALLLISFMGLLSIAFLVIVYLFFRARRKRPSHQIEEKAAKTKRDELP